MSGRLARMRLEKEKEWRRLVTVSLSTESVHLCSSQIVSNG